MSVVWYRILVPIDFYNKIIQASDATLDMEVANIESLLAKLVALLDSWKAVWNEAKLVASSLQIEVKLFTDRSTTARKRTRFHDEDTHDENVNEMNEADESPEETHFQKHTFYVVLDNVTGGHSVRFSAAKQIYDNFSFPWNYQRMSEEELKHKAAKLVEKYFKDISGENLVQEMNHITMVHNANFGRKQLSALELVNALGEYRLEGIFSNLSVSLRMFRTAPVTITSAERSFSKFKLITNYLRSTMDQDRLNNLARLNIESDIATTTTKDCNTVICSFAKKNTCKKIRFY